MSSARSIAIIGVVLTACARPSELVPQSPAAPAPMSIVPAQATPAPVPVAAPAPVYRPPPPPPPPPPPSFNAKSLLLKIGMSEQEVTKVLGQPLKADVMTCGSSTAKPWACKTWTYGDFSSGMRVTFSESEMTGAWLLNNWTVY
jgi:hypothetical protein